jgi:hypothetical protein
MWPTQIQPAATVNRRPGSHAASPSPARGGPDPAHGGRQQSVGWQEAGPALRRAGGSCGRFGRHGVTVCAWPWRLYDGPSK